MTKNSNSTGGAVAKCATLIRWECDFFRPNPESGLQLSYLQARATNLGKH